MTLVKKLFFKKKLCHSEGVNLTCLRQNTKSFRGFMIITIDGPVASGKSSVAKKIASVLNIYYLNTGLLYRAVAYLLAQRNAADGLDLSKISIEEQDLDFVESIEYAYSDGKTQILFDGQDITANLILASVDRAASVVSSNKNVRAALLGLQRKIAVEHDLIADGRDCGSVIFPNADFKFFLTASLDARASRVLSDVARKVDASIDIELIKKQIEERDKRDMEREVAPLVVPTGAIIIDSTELDFDGVIQKFLDVVKK